MAPGSEPVAFIHNRHAPRLYNQEEPDSGCDPYPEPVMEAEEQVHPAEEIGAAEESAGWEDQAQPGGEGGAEGQKT